MFLFRERDLSRVSFRASMILGLAVLAASGVAGASGHHVMTTKQAAPAVVEIAPIDPTCTSSSPCIEYDNNGTGPGIRGISVNGNGLAGATKNISTSLATGREGLIGNDISTSGSFNAGVRGLSVRGFGVAGQSTSGAGVFGLSSNNSGLVGQSTGGVGAIGLSSSNLGVFGSSSSSTGVEGQSSSSNAIVAAVEGTNNGTATAVRANGFGGPLFVGNSSGGVDVFTVDNSGNTLINGNATVNGSATIGGSESVTGSVSAGAVSAGSSSVGTGVRGTGSFAGVIGSNNGTAGAVAVYADGFGGNMFVGNNSGGTNAFVVDNSGNIIITGLIFTGGTCASGCAVDPTKPGIHVTTYAPREAAPTMEDAGEAQLVSGSAYVRLDPAFANVMDQRSNYLVFLTPEGDNRGLYVTQKSLAGFAVRESQGGRSTLAFSYRIVAKPFGQSAPRLATLMLGGQSKRVPVMNLQRPSRVMIPALARHPKVRPHP